MDNWKRYMNPDQKKGEDPQTYLRDQANILKRIEIEVGYGMSVTKAKKIIKKIINNLAEYCEKYDFENRNLYTLEGFKECGNNPKSVEHYVNGLAFHVNCLADDYDLIRYNYKQVK